MQILGIIQQGNLQAFVLSEVVMFAQVFRGFPRNVQGLILFNYHPRRPVMNSNHERLFLKQIEFCLQVDKSGSGTNTSCQSHFLQALHRNE